jgi:hypothetical protein
LATNEPWAKLKADGEGQEYNYPDAGDPPAPLGQKLILLNAGGVAIIGQWRNDGSVLGWRHPFKRNKAKEEVVLLAIAKRKDQQS